MTPAHRMLSNFVHVYQLLQKQKEQKVEAAQNLLSIITTKAIATITVLDPGESAPRAYNAMNSKGKPLTEAEILKAEFWGAAYSEGNRSLCLEIESFWDERSSDVSEQRLSTGLTAAAAGLLPGRYLARQNSKTGIAKIDQLRDWDDIFAERTIEYVWPRATQAVRMFETILSSYEAGCTVTEAKEKLNLETIWVASKSKPVMGAMLRLKWQLNPHDFREAADLTARYFLAARASRPAGIGSFVRTFLNQERFWRSESLTLEDYRDFIHRQIVTEVNAWPTQEAMIDRLQRPYMGDDGTQAVLALENYLYNLEKIESGNTRRLLSIFREDAKKPIMTREHVIPSHPEGFEAWSVSEQERHTELVNLIGNSIPLVGNLNSSAGNRGMESKIESYERASSLDSGVFQHAAPIDEVSSIYRSEGEFGEEQVLRRTQELAHRLAELLVAERPATLNLNSDFVGKSFHKYLKAGATVPLLGVPFTLTEEGNLSLETDESVLVFEKIPELLPVLPEGTNPNILKRAIRDFVEENDPLRLTREQRSGTLDTPRLFATAGQTQLTLGGF